MKEALESLPAAMIAGAGAALAALGYRIIRFHTLSLSVAVFATLGCAVGGHLGAMPLAAVLAAAGAVAGYFLEPVLFYVYVALSAAVGGAAVGIVLALATDPGHPNLVIGACAVACAVIALLDARITTISWTSAAGAAILTLGVLVCRGDLAEFSRSSSRVRAQLPAAAVVFVAVATAAAFFQAWTTREAPAPAVTSPAQTPPSRA